MIKHVSFDCWNTVLRTNPEFTSARSFELSKLFDYPADEMSEIFKRYGSLFDEMEIATGHAVLSNQRIYAVIREIFDRKYTDIFPLNSHINSAMQINDSMVHRHVPILMDPNFPEILRRLHDMNITCSITCNTGNISGRVLRYIFREKLALNFDFLLFSDECGYAKPNPVIFNELYELVVAHHLNDDTNIYSEHILHVGDSIECDYEGALLAGMNAILFDPTKMNYGEIFDAIADQS